MRLTLETSFCHLEGDQRRAHVAAVAHAGAQSEAARELLASATERGVERLQFWADALEFAEEEEARAHRELGIWKGRDRGAHRCRFLWARALAHRTARHMAEFEEMALKEERDREAGR